MKKFKDEKVFLYISDNPKKDFIAPAKLGWKSIRYKNPVGIYKKHQGDVAYEVERRADISEILREIA